MPGCLTFDLMETHDYENMLFCQEKTLGLKAIIAIHDINRQPSAVSSNDPRSLSSYKCSSERICALVRYCGRWMRNT